MIRIKKCIKSSRLIVFCFSFFSLQRSDGADGAAIGKMRRTIGKVVRASGNDPTAARGQPRPRPTPFASLVALAHVTVERRRSGSPVRQQGWHTDALRDTAATPVLDRWLSLSRDVLVMATITRLDHLAAHFPHLPHPKRTRKIRSLSQSKLHNAAFATTHQQSQLTLLCPVANQPEFHDQPRVNCGNAK